ncbi:hypothetical protein [Falsiroseomonas sp. HW251]|uniref:hypothetical protein n=1 Tax=Falsiroseomonas sp. HW251 TaxID=3390998 RepID=UPI003D3125C4
MTRRGRRQKVAANAPSVTHRAGDLQADVEQLRRELAAAQRQLEEVAHSGADAYAKRRMEVLDEARLVARGQALEAAAARAKAEAELRALTDAIAKAPGLSGWLVRRACRKLLTSR